MRKVTAERLRKPFYRRGHAVRAVLRADGKAAARSCGYIPHKARRGIYNGEQSLQPDKGKAAALSRFGVNRLSVGLQSTLDSELKMLGRLHDYKNIP